jgi:hypothetical protein
MAKSKPNKAHHQVATLTPVEKPTKTAKTATIVNGFISGKISDLIDAAKTGTLDADFGEAVCKPKEKIFRVPKTIFDSIESIAWFDQVPCDAVQFGHA